MHIHSSLYILHSLNVLLLFPVGCYIIYYPYVFLVGKQRNCLNLLFVIVHTYQ